jgi:hypothetical protein
MGTRAYPIDAMRATRMLILLLWILSLAGCTSATKVDRGTISVVPIFYATDRAATGRDRPNDRYGAPG